MQQYKTLNVTLAPSCICHVELNRPKRLNAMSTELWTELGACFGAIAKNGNVRVVVLSGAGKMFTAGLDLGDIGFLFAEMEGSRKAAAMRQHVIDFQDAFTSIERCPQPVIAAVHAACIGGGVDLITACDVRLCSADAYFCVKEVDLGLAADVGTLQRLGKVIGSESLVRELAFTARNMHADEALRAGLVSSVHADKAKLMEAALAMAAVIATKSPIGIFGTKHVLNYSRDHSVADGLNYVATWNMAMLQSKDLVESFSATTEKRKPVYEPLYAKL